MKDSIQIILILGLCLLMACQKQSHEQHFQLLSAEQTSIDFVNKIEERADFNILNFHYLYNGGGVGIADFDRDGQLDIIFTANQGESKIYRNEGTLHFSDQTISSGIQTDAWVTGVSIIDINEDGWQDIYLSVGGLDCQGQCNNLLYLNQGEKGGGFQFREQATEYGLDDGFYNQQALFMDFDRDGDLDVYLLRNVIDRRDKNAPSEKKFINRNSQDQLLLQELENGKIVFSPANKQLHFDTRGYGLGITADDFNADGWPDLYVANDFLSEDFLFLNQGWDEEGDWQGFENQASHLLHHQSYNAMGVDAADLNGDGLSEIMVLDMLPAKYERLRSMQGAMNYEKFRLSLKQGYAPQFVRNTLQAHNGLSAKGETLAFSETGQWSNLDATDWSWAPLLADFDNDGDRDVFVTNGYGKDITDLDFVNYTLLDRQQFGEKKEVLELLWQELKKLNEVPLENSIFENQGQLKFKDQTQSWMSTPARISNGAAYADLDGDGDLDLLVNNLNEKAFILENKSPSQHYLRLALQGVKAYGAKVHLWTKDQYQSAYYSPQRSYLSSVEPILHFGLGETTLIDSIRIDWINGQQELLLQPPIDTQLVLIPKTTRLNTFLNKKAGSSTLMTTTSNRPFNYQHQEAEYHDYYRQPLLLKQYSRNGPVFAKSQEGWCFLGAASGQNAQLGKKQNEKWVFNALDSSIYEDRDALFFDADGDGDDDLYIVSGSSEFVKSNPYLQDRLYINQGNLGFQLSNELLPSIRMAGSSVCAGDIDQDGDLDLFIGGQISLEEYPKAPPSYILENRGGRFEIMTTGLGAMISRIGMVNDAAWEDLDNNGFPDLIIVGDWMTITIAWNSGKDFSLEEIEGSGGLWNRLLITDWNQDNQPDLLVGNQGLNTRLQASVEEPLRLNHQDLDQNGRPDPLLIQYFPNKEGQRVDYLAQSADDLYRWMPALKQAFPRYRLLGSSSYASLLEALGARDSSLVIHELQSGLFLNQGGSSFSFQPLPASAQHAPIHAFLRIDLDNDQRDELMVAGNDYGTESTYGYQDASHGLVLRALPEAPFFEPLSPQESGLFLHGEVRQFLALEEDLILVGKTDAQAEWLQIVQPNSNTVDRGTQTVTNLQKD